jgi:hypothetical protein
MFETQLTQLEVGIVGGLILSNPGACTAVLNYHYPIGTMHITNTCIKQDIPSPTEFGKLQLCWVHEKRSCEKWCSDEKCYEVAESNAKEWPWNRSLKESKQ